MDIMDIAIAKALAGGSGGGSVEPLVCRYNGQAGRLDVTCGEIEEAVQNGVPVYYMANEFENGSYQLGVLQSLSATVYDGGGAEMSIEFKFAYLACYADTLDEVRASYPYLTD